MLRARMMACCVCMPRMFHACVRDLLFCFCFCFILPISRYQLSLYTVHAHSPPPLPYLGTYQVQGGCCICLHCFRHWCRAVQLQPGLFARAARARASCIRISDPAR